jgi:hypothetical protein
MSEKVELRATLSADNRMVVLEMLVSGQLVGSLPLSAGDLDYQIGALSRLRAGMADDRLQ